MTTNAPIPDELLRSMLARRAARGSIEGLLPAISRRAATTPQRRRLVPRGLAAGGRLRLAGFVAAVSLVVVVTLAIRPVITGPGTTPVPSPTRTAPATIAPTEAGRPTPESMRIGTTAARRLELGVDVAPIDVTYAFGTIWIADIHADDVRRFDPTTMAELGRVSIDGGPAWFAVADDALWVSTQNGLGLTRIDPATNAVSTTVGADPPCGAPAVLGGNLWQAACDADVFLRIDPTTNAVTKRLPAHGHAFLVAAGGELITSSSAGLARLDPDTGAITELGGAGGNAIFSDGADVWVVQDASVLRVNPADGRLVATFPAPGALAVGFAPGHAWITLGRGGVAEIDLATNAVKRTIELPASAWVPLEVNSVLWVSDFNNSSLWRIEP